MSSLSIQIGKTLNHTLYKDTQEVSGECKNISFLKNIIASYWLSKRNPCLISFLSSATGVAINGSRTIKINAFSHLIEQVPYTQKLNLVTPFSFKRSLIIYSITNSKTVVKLESFGKVQVVAQLYRHPHIELRS